MKRILSCVCVIAAAGIFQAMGQAATWVNVSAGLPTNVLLAAAPGKDRVIAGDKGKSGLYATTDGGTTWTKLGSGGQNMVTCIIFDPIASDTFWVCGIYGSAACVTYDGGTTFQDLGTISHNAGLSVDFTDPQRRTILIGGHESKQVLHKSTDRGATFTEIGPNIPDSASLVGAPLTLDSLTYLVACAGWAGTGRNGIWRTSDGGTTWKMVSTGAALSVPLVGSNGYIYYPMIYQSGLMRSTNRGVTWTNPVGFGFLYSQVPAELPDGRIVSGSFKRRGLSVMNAGAVQMKDLGPVTADSVISVCYNAVRKSFFVCTMNGKGIYRLAYDSTVSSTKLPLQSAAGVDKSKASFTTTGNTFTVPADFKAKKVTATVFSAEGRVIARTKAAAGERVMLPASASKNASIVQIKP